MPKAKKTIKLKKKVGRPRKYPLKPASSHEVLKRKPLTIPRTNRASTATRDHEEVKVSDAVSSLESYKDPSVEVDDDSEMKGPESLPAKFEALNLPARLEQMHALYRMKDGDIMRLKYSD